MKLLKKLAAGFCLSIGLLFLVGAILVSLEKDKSPEDEDAILGFLFFGLPPAVLGGWLTWSLGQDQQQQQSRHLRSVFYRLLRQGDGKLTVLEFSLEAQVSGEVAKAYLDQCAKEFNGDFDVSGSSVVYQFDLVLPDSDEAENLLSEGSTTDPQASDRTVEIWLQDVPSDRKIAIIKEVRFLTGLGLKEAKELVESVPSKLPKPFSPIEAEEAQNRLEKVGASVQLFNP